MTRRSSSRHTRRCEGRGEVQDRQALPRAAPLGLAARVRLALCALFVRCVQAERSRHLCAALGALLLPRACAPAACSVCSCRLQHVLMLPAACAHAACGVCSCRLRCLLLPPAAAALSCPPPPQARLFTRVGPGATGSLCVKATESTGMYPCTLQATGSCA